MQLEIQLDKDFENEFTRLKEIYPKEMFELEGLTEEKLDPTRFFKSFIHSDNVANASIDDNANVNGININTLLNESKKPFDKLLGFNKMFIELKENHSLEDAKKWLNYQISGTTYIHDSACLTHYDYCYNYSLKPVVDKGLFFIPEMRADAPNHLNTFNHHVLQFVSFASTQQAGAVGLSDYLLYSYYFWQKDVKQGYIPEQTKNKYRDQYFQSMIFDLNQPFMKITQSAYTNFTIIDREYFIGLFGGETFPDGSYMIDHVEEFMQYQKDWLRVLSEQRAKKSFTFPVVSLSAIYKDGKYLDEDIVKYVVNHNMIWGDVNMYKSNSVDKISSCCFLGEQSVLTKDLTNGVLLKSFRELNEIPLKDRKNFRIFHNGNWVKGKLNKIDRNNRKLYKVITVNNKELLMTEDHINVTIEGDKPTKKLTTNDYIAFNTLALGIIPETNENLTYEQGVFIGAYLGDGSKLTNRNGIIFSMNKNKIDSLYDTIQKSLSQWNIDYTPIIGKDTNNCIPIIIHNQYILDIVEKYVIGNYCYDKNIDLNILKQSPLFRQGIIDGIYATDGGNSSRIYTTSKSLAYSLEALLTSLGKHSILNITDRTDEKVVIREQEFNRNHVLYCIRFYNYESKDLRDMKDTYIRRNNTLYFKIKDIIDVSDREDTDVFCFEMENIDEPYFTLPNGVITHNCRLVNDAGAIKESKKLEGHFNSIGGSSMNIGSTKVNTINLPRIGYMAKGNFDIAKDIIKDIITNIHKSLHVHRIILKKNIERGLLPLYTHGLKTLESQFGTVGITGVMEYIEAMGGIDRDASGVKYNKLGLKLAEQTLKYINELNENTLSMYGFTANVEQIPGESATIKLCKKDKILFGDVVKTNIYSNQWIALSEQADLMERIRVSGVLDGLCGGGQMLHICLGESYTDFKQAWKLCKLLAKKGVIYYSDIKKFQYCKNDHSFFGKTCSLCGEPAIGDIVKIVGYLVKNAYFKKERKVELEYRVQYKNVNLSEILANEELAEKLEAIV